MLYRFLYVPTMSSVKSGANTVRGNSFKLQEQPKKHFFFFSHLTDHRTERKRNSQRRHLVIFFVVLAIDQIFYTVDFVPVMKVAYENDNHFLFCVSLKVVISFLIIAGEGNY